MEKNTVKTLLIIIGIVLFLNIISLTPVFIPKIVKFNIDFEDNSANINELYIYGKHLNLKGTLNTNLNISKVELVLFDNKENTYNLNYEKNNEIVSFYISDKKNNGFLVDSLNIGNYIIFLKITDIDNNSTYYRLTNNTSYEETEYYTLRKENKVNHVMIKNGEKDTLNINVKEAENENIYDVVVDAGHGGIDPGACYKSLCETDFTLTLSKKLKQKLEEYGLKVKLTRDDNASTDVKFETYGKDGRIDKAMSSRAKYLFSFHLNSGLYSRTGTEIYTTNNIDYTLAKSIVDSIVSNTNTNYSNNPVFKVANGIYLNSLSLKYS